MTKYNYLVFGMIKYFRVVIYLAKYLGILLFKTDVGDVNLTGTIYYLSLPRENEGKLI